MMLIVLSYPLCSVDSEASDMQHNGRLSQSRSKANVPRHGEAWKDRVFHEAQVLRLSAHGCVTCFSHCQAAMEPWVLFFR